MSAAASLLTFLSRWIDDVAAGLARSRATLRRGRRIELTEQADGSFLASVWRKGSAAPLNEPPLSLELDRFAEPVSARLRALLARSRVDVVLAPSRFVFRPLDLPRAAEPFLEGVVRAQIDRLTPWSGSDAAFGWSAPAHVGSERIALTVAATARTLLTPIVQALIPCRVDSIWMSTRAGDDGTLVIPILARQAGDENSPAAFVSASSRASASPASLASSASSSGPWSAPGMTRVSRNCRIRSPRAARTVEQRGSADEQALRALPEESGRRPQPS